MIWILTIWVVPAFHFVNGVLRLLCRQVGLGAGVGGGVGLAHRVAVPPLVGVACSRVAGQVDGECWNGRVRREAETALKGVGV
jgi:hypothetical protein